MAPLAPLVVYPKEPSVRPRLLVCHETQASSRQAGEGGPRLARSLSRSAVEHSAKVSGAQFRLLSHAPTSAHCLATSQESAEVRHGDGWLDAPLALSHAGRQACAPGASRRLLTPHSWSARIAQWSCTRSSTPSLLLPGHDAARTPYFPTPTFCMHQARGAARTSCMSVTSACIAWCKPKIPSSINGPSSYPTLVHLQHLPIQADIP